MASAKATCPLCKQRLVPPAGPREADILIAGEFPGWTEIRTGVPFSDRAGDVLRRELQRVGLHYGACRITNLWLHVKHKGGRKKVEREEQLDEMTYHLRKLYEEMQGRSAILLLGSDVIEAVLGHKGSDIYGLDALDVSVGLPVRKFLLDKIPKSAKILVAAPNPAALYQKGQVTGELTLALDKFAGAYQRLKKEAKAWAKRTR